MKSQKLLLPLIIASCFAAGALFADEAKKEMPAKAAGCCASAEAKGEKCSHSCCVEAAKAENNCEKCKGSGKIEKKEAKEKKEGKK